MTSVPIDPLQLTIKPEPELEVHSFVVHITFSVCASIGNLLELMVIDLPDLLLKKMTDFRMSQKTRPFYSKRTMLSVSVPEIKAG